MDATQFVGLVADAIDADDDRPAQATHMLVHELIDVDPLEQPADEPDHRLIGGQRGIGGVRIALLAAGLVATAVVVVVVAKLARRELSRYGAEGDKDE